MPLKTGLQDRDFRLAACILAIVGFSLNLAVSWNFYRRNVYYCIDNVFDADPAVYLRYAMGIAQNSRRHPLMTLFTLPLSVPAGLAEDLLHLPFRMWAVILYGPAAAAAKTLLLMFTMRRVGLPLWWSMAIALADILSFSRLTVGSLPESFGPTSAVFALLFFLSARAITGERLRISVWIACGVLLGGITITNMVPWALVLCCVMLQTGAGWRVAMVRTAQAGVAAAVVMAAMYGAMLAAFRPPLPGHSDAAAPALRTPAAGTPDTQWLRFNPMILVKGIPIADAYAFAGPQPAVDYNTPDPLAFYVPGHLVPRMAMRMPLGLKLSEALPLLLVHGLAALGILGWFTGFPWNRQLGIPALLVVGFQFTLHCFWSGPEMFLYVLHWQTALLILMAGAWFRRGWIRTAALTGLLALIVCEAVMNSRNIAFAMQVLDPQFLPK